MSDKTGANANENANATSRYAIYFAPHQDSAWWRCGSAWLGRDAVTDAACIQPALDCVDPLVQKQLTAAPRKYGLHATLKAPFRLAPDCTEDDIVTIALALAAKEKRFLLPQMQVQLLRQFLALKLPPESTAAAQISALATQCVTAFDHLRAHLTPAELARRRRSPITPRQEVLLERWGYPYTEEEFCLHLTLSGRLDTVNAETAKALLLSADRFFADATEGAPMIVDALTIFRQDQTEGPFKVWRRFGFGD